MNFHLNNLLSLEITEQKSKTVILVDWVYEY